MKPRARRKRLVVRRLGDETLVYDLDSHQAHCLNATADAVWRLCDGRRTVAEIARAARPASPVARDADVVHLALRQLGEAGLLVEAEDAAALPRGPSRRELLVRLGKGVAVLLPMVSSVVAPTPAQAASPTCQAGGSITQAECKTDNPANTGCCCSDKGPFLCIEIDPGVKWGCDGPPCVP